MKTYRIAFLHVLIMGFLSALFACAGPSKQQTQTSKEQPITESKVVQGVEKLQLASIDNFPKVEPLKTEYYNIIIRSLECNDQIKRDYSYAPVSCKAFIISQLKSKNAYQHVSEDMTKGFPGKTILADMKIVDMRIASGAARFWGGAFAGNSFMDVLLELKDADTKEVVHRTILSTSNNAFAAAWNMGSSDRSLPSDLGTLIGEYIFRVVPSPK